jgi:23S rRNA (uridine2552-2'-O)-methyltransferase
MSASRQPDRFSRRAKDEGYAARSVYKLQEIDQRWRVIPRGGRVLDLGCAPGSWSQYVVEKGGPGTKLVGIDVLEVRGYPGEFIHASILETSADTFREKLGGPADLVISDMAPNTSGQRSLDHLRQIALVEMARDVALQILRPGGAFVAKVFEGGDAHAFCESLRPHFREVKRIKPEATRSISVEFFVVALGRKG